MKVNFYSLDNRLAKYVSKKFSKGEPKEDIGENILDVIYRVTNVDHKKLKSILKDQCICKDLKGLYDIRSLTGDMIEPNEEEFKERW